MSRKSWLAAAAAIPCAFGAIPAGTANAYGTDHLYEITLSYNCQNIPVCSEPSDPFGVGGLWGWLEPDAGNSVDGQLQLQGHANANRPYLNGPAHSSGFIGWTIVSCTASGSGPGVCALLAPEGVPPDPNDLYFEIGADFEPAIGVLPVLTPATPGEYSLHPAPGIDSEVSVHQV